jgi:hypothetical protein
VPINLSIRAYSEFYDQLVADLNDFKMKPIIEWKERAMRAVDGLAADELRRLVDLETRRKYGAFFTPSTLASKVASELFPKFDDNVVLYDPTSGAGNLLLAGLDYINENNILPLNKHFLLGTDIHSEFISTANCRLQIKQLLIQRNDLGEDKGARYDIQLCNGLLPNPFYARSTHIFVNPPFNLMPCPKDIEWSKGKVSAAALFMHRIIENIKPQTTITAILPEVLRSGSRYEPWRRMVLDNCINEKVLMLGQFDEHADVDVFGVLLTKRSTPIIRKRKNNKFIAVYRAQRTVEDQFLISVGPVVDNRDEHTGRRRGYIVSRGLPGWSVQTRFTHTRNYRGKCFRGPFIVVKRTSRMGDTRRAIATIINTPKPVYVDNHLIILQPKSGLLRDCNAMVENLKNPRTDDWLNRQIRCRHLTVKIVAEIPIWQ